MADLRNAVVVGGNRVPFGKIGGAYASATNIDLLTAAIDGLVARFGLAGERLGEVGAGAVLKHSRDFNLTREAVLSSALSAQTPAYDVGQACATSLTAAVQLSNRIRAGQLDVAIAGGVDSASDSPIAVNDRLRKTLLKLNAAKTPMDKVKTLATVRPSDLAPEVPRAAEPRTGLNMGQHQALTTAHWGITRQAQDELAAASHHNLAKAWDAGFFDDLVTPYLGLTRDQTLRADTSVEKLAKLRPVFGDGPDATMTAGNSTPLSDGAATVLLAEEGWARDRNLPVLARIVDAETAAVDYLLGEEGLLMAPAHAAARLLTRNGLALQDFDFYEIHEAFASTVLCTLAAWESDDYCRTTLGLDGALGSIDRAKLNVNGSSLAAGHPFAATGARILASLAKMLAQQGSGARGLISVCAAGGQGVVAIVEAI
ncbi:MAG TPA: acetyl-CoA C-acetyltransferase [Micropruina sp.]|nr:acetyl-CoA C-acetyltransferase [Micropruina sp.]